MAEEIPKDEELLARFVQQQSFEAFTHLVTRHKDGLVRYGIRFLGDQHLAEEIAQEVFIRLFEAGTSFDRRRPFRPWLYSIAANLCRNEARGAKHRPALLARLPEPAAQGPPALADHEAWREAFGKLPEREREALLLREFQEMGYKEIAQVMGAPVNSVRTWIHRGRQLLRKLLGREGQA